MTIADPEILNAAILVVDDQEANVALLEQLLQESGYACVTSTMDPLAVCGLHEANNYDLILLDLQMPGMDGFQVMEALKASDRAGAYLPVLVITAQPSHKLKALQAGARDFVSKPFDVVELRTRIRNTLELHLLYRKLEDYNKVLEQTVLERTAELRASEARYRGLTELASDWYWEQDEDGAFTHVCGPVRELLAIRDTSDAQAAGWNEAERRTLRDIIAARRPFLDYVFSRVNADGSQQRFQLSGEPMFNQSSRFIGYRGVGVELAGAR